MPYANRTKGSTGRKPGRPRAVIDWALVKRQLSAGASGSSIAYELGIAAETLYLRCQEDNGMEFSAFRLLHFGRGNDLIAMKQFEVAMRGDKTMLVWLGKNRLGQRDRQEFTNAAGEAIPIVMVQVLPPSTNAGE